MITVVLDTNALLFPFRFGIDLEDEVLRLVGTCRMVVPAVVLEELLNLRKAGNRMAAAALRYAERFETDPGERPVRVERERDVGAGRGERGDGRERGERGDGRERGERGDGKERGERGDGRERGERGDGKERGERGDGRERGERGDGRERGDKAILDTAVRLGAILVTSDRELIARAGDAGLKVMFLRGGQKLELK